MPTHRAELARREWGIVFENTNTNRIAAFCIDDPIDQWQSDATGRRNPALVLAVTVQTRVTHTPCSPRSAPLPAPLLAVASSRPPPPARRPRPSSSRPASRSSTTPPSRLNSGARSRESRAAAYAYGVYSGRRLSASSARSGGGREEEERGGGPSVIPLRGYNHALHPRNGCSW